ncbi:MAG: metallophosphoesterase [Firmicutes bacterium]|jgi:predicted MPP superfamily phosphohydrolase|nr:metallophosphoesterase [Bacillota bacterium]HPU01230.1 metallophosphoesterase [Bacillota bacterium]
MDKWLVKTFLVPALAILAVAGFLIYGNNAIKITRFRISVDKLPRGHAGLRIVHISDLHGKEFGKQNRRLARAIAGLEPHLVFVSGDMINSYSDDGSAFINLLNELEGICPVYCSLGNHEQIARGTRADLYDRFIERLRKAGAVLLDNERAEIEIGGATLGLYGFTAELYHYSSRSISEIWKGAELKEQDIVDKLGRPRDDEIAILLAHNPKYFQEYARWGADLVFSGHIHGGVVRLPFLGGLLSPDVTFFPPYSAGLYRSGKTTMHVSRGLGNSVIPIRIFNRPDVSFIVLEP